eukprot:203271-Prorocentrum_minimum.AAC.4
MSVHMSLIHTRHMQQVLHINPKYVVGIDVGSSITVEGITVTLLDADHCPGDEMHNRRATTPRTLRICFDGVCTCRTHILFPQRQKQLASNSWQLYSDISS